MERLSTIVIVVFVILSLLPTLWLAFELIRRGLPNINLGFFSETTPDALKAIFAKNSQEEGMPGGILNALLGSIFMIFIALILTFPISFFISVYIYEHKNTRFGQVLKAGATIINGIPSLVIAIIVYLWIVNWIHGFSALAGGISLAIIMLPLLIFYNYKALETLPVGLKESGIALGGSNFSILIWVLFSSSYRKILAGILYTLSEAIGKTTPLLFTALGASLVNWNILEPTSALPLLIWDIYEISYLTELLWAAAFVLVLIALLFYLAAQQLSKHQ